MVKKGETNIREMPQKKLEEFFNKYGQKIFEEMEQYMPAKVEMTRKMAEIALAPLPLVLTPEGELKLGKRMLTNLPKRTYELYSIKKCDQKEKEKIESAFEQKLFFDKATLMRSQYVIEAYPGKIFFRRAVYWTPTNSLKSLQREERWQALGIYFDKYGEEGEVEEINLKKIFEENTPTGGEVADRFLTRANQHARRAFKEVESKLEQYLMAIKAETEQSIQGIDPLQVAEEFIKKIK